MFTKRFAIGAALLLTSVCSHAELTVGDFKAADHANVTLLAHISGLGTGLQWMNTYLVAKKRESVFCIPPKLSTNAQNDVVMLEMYIGEHKPKDDTPIGLILLEAYLETYPCK
ncbi:hypothetical protein [Burkholderia diffusa]|uniref:hypothetical protein n=1 Tax=Burkholderia diffusa TaxID=488732 RepID=UPI000756F8E1|nr:hypothetical protein [Burkholderia diffusa]KVG33860.1 hypothetical protein WJ30_07245 [Burkholderia diffusa]